MKGKQMFWGIGDYYFVIGDKIIAGYGSLFYPNNPNDFKPDPRWSTDEEIANHIAACWRYDMEKK